MKDEGECGWKGMTTSTKEKRDYKEVVQQTSTKETEEEGEGDREEGQHEGIARKKWKVRKSS